MNVQYVSVLRPPKVIPPTLNGNKTVISKNEEACGAAEGRRRVRSLTNTSVPALRNNVPRRSLHNLPSTANQLHSSVENELKKRRRLAGFDQTYRQIKTSDCDSEPEPGEPTGTHGHEWKQVGSGGHCLLCLNRKNILHYK